MSLYKQPGSTIWWTRFSTNGEKFRLSTGEHDRAAAQRVENRLRAQQDTQPKLKGKTFGGAVLKWAEAETRSESDLQSLAKFGTFYKDRALSAVTADNLSAALKQFCLTDGTYNRYVGRLQAVLALSGVKLALPKRRDKQAKVRDWITQAEWVKLRAELPPHQKLMAEFSILTGLRQANVLGLQWSRVDLERSMVWVDATDSKNDKPIGVPLGTDAKQILVGIAAGKHDEVWVFTFRGKPISEIKTAFQAACVRAGLGQLQGRPADGPASAGATYSGFTWHGLRHSWATWHAQNGTPLEVLKELGGWTDMRMLVERYAHHVAGLKAGYADNVKEKK